MNKYHVYLADNYNRKEPFTTDWDYELIGDVLRAEFDEYLIKEEAIRGENGKKLFKGELVKKFMIQKRINLVDNPADGNLKSVFVLRPGEKKLIDERAKNSLAPRFERKERKNLDGIVIASEGFMEFDLVEGSEKKGVEETESFQVSGNDIEYFNDTQEATQEEVAEVFACDKCGKEFDGRRALNAHKLSCKA